MTLWQPTHLHNRSDFATFQFRSSSGNLVAALARFTDTPLMLLTIGRRSPLSTMKITAHAGKTQASP